MAFRRPPSGTSNSTSYSYSNTAAPTLPPAPITEDSNLVPVPSPTMRKRQRTLDMHPGTAAPPDPQAHHTQPGAPPVTEDAFINDQDAVESGGDEDDEEEKPKSDKKAGRRKIKIEFIQDKSRRHITFSKRKAGIMKKAYELSTLTGTQVLLLVVSETGLVYTFTTAKLQPLVTQPEGKNLIQACLNAPHGTLPSSMPVGQPIGRSQGPLSMGGPTAGSNNLPGGLSISGSPSGGVIKEDEAEADDDDVAHSRATNTGEKRRRRTSSTAGATSGSGPNTRNSGPGAPTSPHSPNTSIPPPLSIPPPSQHQQGSQPPHPQQTQQQQPQGAPPQINLGSPTSPQQQHSQAPTSQAQYTSGSYGGHGGHHQHSPHAHDTGMYASHMMPPGAPYSYTGPGGPGGQGSGQPLGGLAAAAAQQHQHWGPGPQPQVSQGGGHYGRR